MARQHHHSTNSAQMLDSENSNAPVPEAPSPKTAIVRQICSHIAFSVVCGAICGLGSVLLCICVGGARTVFISHHWLIWLLPALGVLQLAMYRALHLAPDTTTESVIRNIRRGNPTSGLLAPGILLSTCMTMLGGGAVGKEAGALQMGASLGATVARPFHLRDIFHRGASADASTHRTINSCVAATGMAAEFSALFFSPLGSCVLVIELLGFSQLRFLADILIACFTAYGVARIFNIGDIITPVPIPHMSWSVVGICIIVGVCAALFGSIFASVIRLIQDLTRRIFTNLYFWVVLVGIGYAALVCLTGWWKFTGSGGSLLNTILVDGSDVSWDFLIKMLLVVLCLGFWFKGGEIMPSLCIGGLLGSACTVMTGTDPLFGAAVGALCFFAAAERVPAAAILMGCEIFGWSMGPFMLIAVAVAFLFSYPVGIYGAGADLMARAGAWGLFKDRVRLHGINDEADSDRGPFDNIVQAVRAIKRLRAGQTPDETVVDPETVMEAFTQDGAAGEQELTQQHAEHSASTSALHSPRDPKVS